MKIYKAILVVFALLNLTACIDNSWDLSRIKQEEILLFSEGITLPVGKLDLIRFDRERMEKLLPDLTNNLFQQGDRLELRFDAGDERISTTDIQGEIMSKIRFLPSSHIASLGEIPAVTPLPDGNYPIRPRTFPLDFTEVEVDEYLKRLDAIYLVNGRFRIDYRLEGLSAAGVGSMATIRLRFPNDFKLTRESTPDYTVSGQEVTLSISAERLMRGSVVSIEVSLEELGDPMRLQQVELSGEFRFESASVNQTIQLTVDVIPEISGENILKVKGLFDYAFDPIVIEPGEDILGLLYQDFGEDALLDFYAPVLNLAVKSTLTAPVLLDVHFSYNDKSGAFRTDSLWVLLSPASESSPLERDYQIGDRLPTDPASGSYAFDLSGIFRQGRSNLKVTVKARLDASVPQQTMMRDMEADIVASLQMPFVFGSRLKAFVHEKKERVFTSSIRRLLFEADGSEVVFEAKVVKELPLNLDLKLSVLNEALDPIDVEIADVSLTDQAEQLVRFVVSAQEAPKMGQAYGLQIEGLIYSDEEKAGREIVVTDYVDIREMKLRKKGGVIVKP